MAAKATPLVILLIVLSSFIITGKTNSGYDKLRELELKALIDDKVGQEYIYDLTGIKDCNKTRIKYLGVVTTTKGKQYKILTSFFVFSTSKDMCHGTSAIKIYDSINRFIGQYYVGMPEGLPDALKNNNLIYLDNSEECNLRNERSINFSEGLPKCFFIRCSKNGGDEYCFSNGH